jgi:hypothetical protein
MREICNRVCIGSMEHHRYGDREWSVVHACKHPCHQQAVGYSGNLPKSHPNYLIMEKESDLYMNLIDPPVPLFQSQSFAAFRKFAAREHESGKKIFIHCNQGLSRAPALALLFMAKDLNLIPNENYKAANAAFRRVFPNFSPGKGIESFLHSTWEEL